MLINGGELFHEQKNGEIETITKSENLPKGTKVYPGGLTVTRSIGDAESKIVELGGNPLVLVCEPQIFSFPAVEQRTIALCSRGITQGLKLEQVRTLQLRALDHCRKTSDELSDHDTLGLATEAVLKSALQAKCRDNSSVILIGLPGL